MSITVVVTGTTGAQTSITNSDTVNVSVGGTASPAINVASGTAWQAQVPQLMVLAGANITVSTTSGSFTIVGRDVPVQSVQGRTGNVTITRTDLTAAAAVHQHNVTDIIGLTSIANVASINGLTGTPSIVAGSNVTVTTAANSITIAAAAAGGGAVSSVNGRTGVVTLNSTLVSAASAQHSHVAADISNFTNVANVVSVQGRTGAVSLIAADVTAASSTHAHNYVQSLNAITGTPSIVAGSNITVTTSANSITIAGGAGSVSSVNGQTGAVTLNSTLVSAASAQHSHVVADISNFTNVANVVGVNGITGSPAIVAGSNVTVTTAGSSITIAGSAPIKGDPGSFGTPQALKSVTANYTLVLDDAGKLLLVDSTNAITVTIPLNSSVAFDTGTHIDVARVGAGGVVATAASGATVNSTPGTNLRARYSTGTLIKTNTNTWLLVGDIAS